MSGQKSYESAGRGRGRADYEASDAVNSRTKTRSTLFAVRNSRNGRGSMANGMTSLAITAIGTGRRPPASSSGDADLSPTPRVEDPPDHVLRGTAARRKRDRVGTRR